MAYNIHNENTEYFKLTTIIIKLVALLIGCIILFFSQYAFIFYSAAMIPTVIVIFVDRRYLKCASATICTFNLIGVLPYLTQIWNSISLDATSKLLISDIKTWGVVYGTAIIGQFLYWILPRAFAKLHSIKVKVEVAILHSQRDRICSDWSVKLDDLERKPYKIREY